jgi:hypothetical protein
MKKQRLKTCAPGTKPVRLSMKDAARWKRKLAQKPQPPKDG